jgi:hypothetical protein
VEEDAAVQALYPHLPACVPAGKKVTINVDIVRGAVAYVSGRIAKLAPDSVRLKTPASIVGVRGTTLVIRAGD